jgi:GT2 family glycosyltransferase
MTQLLKHREPNAPTSYRRHVATVVLSYNSHADLQLSAPQLAGQLDVKHTLIIVDNASHVESVARVSEWLAKWRPDAISGTQVEVEAWVKSHPEEVRQSGRVYFILSGENRGYSAGNNIGIRLADALDADAVLIANPDMRIEDPHYLSRLTKYLFADERNYVAASRILGVDGKDQNPLRESTFLEEFFWPAEKLFGANRYVLRVSGKIPISVPKVSGCCMLLRMSFLKAINQLDENVFLYSEEAIITAKAKKTLGKIIFVPNLSAIHAHIATEKGDPSRRMAFFVKSRLYYLHKYSGYANWKLVLLNISYKILIMMHKIRGQIANRHA